MKLNFHKLNKTQKTIFIVATILIALLGIFPIKHIGGGHLYWILDYSRYKCYGDENFGRTILMIIAIIVVAFGLGKILSNKEHK